MNVRDLLSRTGKNNRPSLGCFPLYPPLELFHSMGITPVILWGLRETVEGLDESDRHLPNYTCSVARYLVEFLLSNGSELLDGIFMYNAGDTLRNLPEIIEHGLRERGRKAPPFLKLHVPAVSTEQSPFGAEYLGARIRKLTEECSDLFDTEFSESRFRESVNTYRRWRSLLLEGDRAVAAGKVSFADFQQAAMAGHFIPVEEHIHMMEDFIARAEGCVPGGSAKPVILSGILPPPRQATLAMEKAGLRIAGNDIASLYRSYARTPETTGDATAYYTDFYQNHFPCTTILHQVDKRLDAVADLARARGAEGIVFIGEKFCEYEHFEFPLAEKRCKELGLQTIFLEFTTDDRDDAAQLETRIETFVEMLP